MRLGELISDIEGATLRGDADVRVGQVREDSRKVEPGDVFVAVKGLTVDGHDYVQTAVERGAAAVVVERAMASEVCAQVIVKNAARALGLMAARRAGRPSDKMCMIGIGGTNGKTTTTYLVEAILEAAGKKPGVIGTVNYRYAGQQRPAPYTTPTALALNEQLGDMLAAKCSHVVMETSSIALLMERLSGVYYQVGAFTNLTQDHLDVHGDMSSYFDAKAKLFAERMATDGTVVAVVDDQSGYGDAMLSRAPKTLRKLRVSLQNSAAQVFVAQAETTIQGIRATLRTPSGEIEIASSQLFGDYNVANAAVAVAIAEALGVSLASCAQGISNVKGVPGRVERVSNARQLDVFVDYAHTPDALSRVIDALRPLTAKRLIVVFGCGGDRDQEKRPKMGRIVADKADVAVVTSDNPRTEDPDSIVKMIVGGMPARPDRHDIVDVDRKRAIASAVGLVQAGDVLLIAGKGHEDYQILGTEKIHFDDREQAASAIAALS